jgi:hypothetical protein
MTMMIIQRWAYDLQTFSSLTVQWTTHNMHGITAKDIALARYSDEEATSIGIVKPTEAQKCGPAP